jgi:hypothetical protein
MVLQRRGKCCGSVALPPPLSPHFSPLTSYLTPQTRWSFVVQVTQAQRDLLLPLSFASSASSIGSRVSVSALRAYVHACRCLCVNVGQGSKGKEAHQTCACLCLTWAGKQGQGGRNHQHGRLVLPLLLPRQRARPGVVPLSFSLPSVLTFSLPPS